jgi:molybdate transport system substrate-binding protein
MERVYASATVTEHADLPTALLFGEAAGRSHVGASVDHDATRIADGLLQRKPRFRRPKLVGHRASALGAMIFGPALCLAACGGQRAAGPDRPEARPAEPPSEVVVFAAASLAEALPDAVAACGDHSLAPVFSFGGSNVLARQIEAARGADLFFSADESWMDRLEERGRLAAGTRRAVLSNTLVAIVRSNDPAAAIDEIDFAALFAAQPERRLVLADPEAVPAGRYARAFLERARVDGESLWDRLAGRVVPALDVRAALHLVEALPLAAGIVYRTDLEASDDVRELFTVPEALAPAIRYGAAAIAGSLNPEAARRLLSCLERTAASAAFERHGFLPLDGGE